MFDQQAFGKRIRDFRRERGLSQKEAAFKIGVSEQAISKWENGVCLPDVYNLKLLGEVLGISVDSLLDVESKPREKIVETFKVGGVVFELVEKPETIYGGKFLYANNYHDLEAFHAAIDATPEGEKQYVYKQLHGSVLPVCDIQLSINFWREAEIQAYGFVREVSAERQPEGVEVFKMPASLFVRGYTDPATAQLLAKEQCETWELFAYIRNYFMPAHGFKMADNGAQELEIFDTSEHRTGYVYVPVTRI